MELAREGTSVYPSWSGGRKQSCTCWETMERPSLRVWHEPPTAEWGDVCLFGSCYTDELELYSLKEPFRKSSICYMTSSVPVSQIITSAAWSNEFLRLNTIYSSQWICLMQDKRKSPLEWNDIIAVLRRYYCNIILKKKQ